MGYRERGIENYCLGIPKGFPKRKIGVSFWSEENIIELDRGDVCSMV